MDKRYELYCLVDPLFYDSPSSPRTDQGDFEVARRGVPPGWRHDDLDEWVVYTPPDSDLPLQGWKIHVSACLDNAEEVLARVWDFCVSRQVSFKFLPGRIVLHMRNAKYAPRGASGKLVTIYPADDSECELILKELGEILDGQPGPYILSDLRWGAGPLYVRYGGFAERYCEDERGELVLAIEDGSGKLVPDRRGPVFTVPSWVTLPDFLVPHLEARNSVTMTDLPYRIERALHFSNGGGVYAARDLRTGGQVVLKEARPYAGLAADGADAVARLQREREILDRLAGLDAAPGVLDYFTLGDHHFLVEEFIDGRPLNEFFAERHPLLDPEPKQQKIADYTAWALRVCRGVERAVAAIHQRGVVINDLHMFNIMVRPDDSVALIDFEVAAHVSEGRRPTIGNPGFVAPRDRSGFDIDRYSMACLRLAMFMPMTTLFGLDLSKSEHLAGLIAEHFPVSRPFLDEAVREIRRDTDRGTTVAGTGSGHSATRLPRLTPDRTGWDASRESIAKAILASATPDRDDRLFPGDIEQFNSGALGLAYGAAGVLYALQVTGAGRYPQYEEWLLSRATRPDSGTRLGLYDGLHGVAYVLQELGYDQQALDVLGICLDEKWERLGPDLHGGLAGIGLNLAHLANLTDEPGIRDAAMRAADIAADRVTTVPSVADSEREGLRQTGLLRGFSGAALLFIRLYEQTGDSGFLDCAATALRRDLDHCVLDHNGAMQVDEGWRILPYLGDGSVGIGCAVDDYLAHRTDERFAEASEAIRRAALSPYYAQAGLFNGRAGMILYLSRRHRAGVPGRDPDVGLQLRNLDWHALPYRGHLAFAGDQLFRLSMDLATGTAGVLLALGAALRETAPDQEPVQLPFLGPARRSDSSHLGSNLVGSRE